MSETSDKAKELAEKGKAAALDGIGKISEKADSIPFLKGNKVRKLIALGIVVVIALIGVFWLFSSPSIESVTKEILVENVGKQFGKHVVVESVSDLKLTEVKKDKWKGSADVVLKDKKNGKVSEKLKYDLRVHKKGDTVEVEYASRALIEFMKALNELDEEELGALLLLGALAEDED